MRPSYVTDAYLENFIVQALEEDVGSGDHSTLSTIPVEVRGRARLMMKEEGVIAGLQVAEAIYRHLDPEVILHVHVKDGDRVSMGEHILTVEGPTRAILTGERLALNCMQRMSGIATYTQRLVRLVSGTKAKILDTRKTGPNVRPLEKWAVLLGGGTNHRIGLYDMVMLKDNHIDFSGGISRAVFKAKDYLKKRGLDIKIEVETRNLYEVKEALDTRQVDIIMLDNMDNETMQKAVLLIDGKCETEASGGITEENILGVARTGVDYISIGALTHSVKSLDMSLKAEIL